MAVKVAMIGGFMFWMMGETEGKASPKIDIQKMHATDRLCIVLICFIVKGGNHLAGEPLTIVIF
jgi:hypothetical protein